MSKTKSYFYPCFSTSLLLLALLILASAVFSVILLLPINYALAVGLSYALAFTSIILYVKYKHKDYFKLNYRISNLELLPISLISVFSIIVISDFIIDLIPPILPTLSEELMRQIEKVTEDKFIAFITLAILPAIFEEIIFRGIILRGFLKNYSPLKSILLSAIIFGAIHLNVEQFIVATFAGIIIGMFYWKTKSLFYPIIIHFFNNLVSLLLINYSEIEMDESIENLFSENSYLKVLITAFISLVIVISILLLKKTKQLELVIASMNKNKTMEFIQMLPKDMKIYGLNEIDPAADIEETGETLEENAEIKSDYVFKKYGKNNFADDTGLEVEYLNGEPGVKSARYAGESCSSEDNINKLLDKLEGTENREAKFKTIISLNIDGVKEFFEGICKGKIITNRKGLKGFGYDPVFIPNNENKTFAEMTSEQKNLVSHRALATNKLIKFLSKVY